MSCHTMPYPYLVYYCHSPAGGTKLFRVMLGGQADREIVEAVALCHMDTSKWDRDNPSFRVLNIEPGKGPVCHFFPRYDIAWAALPE
ncbi:BURP domain protein USPL1 [Linum perenne]